MSGYVGDAFAEDGAIDPGVLLLTKPFTKSELAAMVRQALDTPNVSAAAT